MQELHRIRKKKMLLECGDNKKIASSKKQMVGVTVAKKKFGMARNCPEFNSSDHTGSRSAKQRLSLYDHLKKMLKLNCLITR
jgi:hypothetical protein